MFFKILGVLSWIFEEQHKSSGLATRPEGRKQITLPDYINRGILNDNAWKWFSGKIRKEVGYGK